METKILESFIPGANTKNKSDVDIAAVLIITKRQRLIFRRGKKKRTQ